MAMAGRPPTRRKASLDPIGRSGRDSIVALLLAATIVSLAADSVPIGVAVFCAGALVAGAALRRSRY
jgi:hypothetical protein